MTDENEPHTNYTEFLYIFFCYLLTSATTYPALSTLQTNQTWPGILGHGRTIRTMKKKYETVYTICSSINHSLIIIYLYKILENARKCCVFLYWPFIDVKSQPKMYLSQTLLLARPIIKLCLILQRMISHALCIIKQGRPSIQGISG